MLESGLPDVLELFVRVEDYLIQHRGFWLASFVVLEPVLLALPCVACEHTQGVIVKSRVKVAWLGVVNADQNPHLFADER